MGELFGLFFGQATVAQVGFNFILINLGILTSVAIHVHKGVKNCKESPDSFNINYFLVNNWARIFIIFITMLITWIFIEEFVKYLADFIPAAFARATPFILGLLNDRIYVWITLVNKK